MIPAGHALRSALALKLWSIERKRHIMALAADEGLALFAGLNAIPTRSYLAEYSSWIDHAMTTTLLAAWQEPGGAARLWPGRSFNLDFHSVPYDGEHPVIERHYVSMAATGYGQTGGAMIADQMKMMSDHMKMKGDQMKGKK